MAFGFGSKRKISALDQQLRHVGELIGVVQETRTARRIGFHLRERVCLADFERDLSVQDIRNLARDDYPDPRFARYANVNQFPIRLWRLKNVLRPKIDVEPRQITLNLHPPLTDEIFRDILRRAHSG